MREIKFRAWNPAGNMLSPFALGDADTNIKYIAEHNWRVMQYTGLLDKNGEEIYEGDVIGWEGEEGSWGMGVTRVRREVKFKDGAFYTHTEFTVNENCLPILATWGEVIGNIYENPELLL